MLERKYLQKIKTLVSSGGEGMNLSQSILYALAMEEKILPILKGNSRAQQVFIGLRRYKFIRRTKNEKYLLTPKGEDKLRTIFIDEVVIKNPAKWDGKWRLVMYDLPVRFKKARDSLRWKLKDLGFYQFQKSVWMYPYPCEGELLFVADFYGVRKHIEILEVNKVLDDSKLKSYFGLT